MENTFLLDRWVQINEKYARFWSGLILFLLSIAFTVTDWLIGIFTLSDFLFGFILVALFISANFRITWKQVIWILLILGVITANIAANYFYNDQFILKTGLMALVKVGFYAVVITGAYNYVNRRNLEKAFLLTNNWAAVVVCLIGVYITLALFSEGALPYEFFWTFTRTDLLSYAFNENTQFIRTRSIFSEPAYLGYYLNILLGMNYFNKVGVKVHPLFNGVLTFAIFLTFSYSALGIMLMIQFLYFFQPKKLKKFRWQPSYWMIVALFGVVLFFSWNLIERTILQRTIEILNGQDGSAYFRIIRSWDYVNTEHIFRGNGIGHTPAIWNIYAYMISDLGLVAFILSILFSVSIVLVNFPMGTLFIALNFQKGGYLSPAFWLFLLLLFLYMGDYRGILQERITAVTLWKTRLLEKS